MKKAPNRAWWVLAIVLLCADVAVTSHNVHQLYAQTVPVEQTIMDLTLRAAPGNQGQCFLLAAGGKLDVSFQSADADFDPMIPPVTLGLGPYRTSPAGPGSPPEVQNVPVTPALTTVSLPVSSGLYCYGLYLSLPLNTPVAVGPAQTAQWRYVALKMVLTPQ